MDEAHRASAPDRPDLGNETFQLPGRVGRLGGQASMRKPQAPALVEQLSRRCVELQYGSGFVQQEQDIRRLLGPRAQGVILSARLGELLTHAEGARQVRPGLAGELQLRLVEQVAPGGAQQVDLERVGDGPSECTSNRRR